MDINITFFVQLFHFLIAYLIIERFLLKPVYRTLQRNDYHMQALFKGLEAQKSKVKNKELQKHQEWQSVQQSFTELMPQPVQAFDAYTLDTPLVALSQQKQQEYQKLTENLLIKRLNHVSY